MIPTNEADLREAVGSGRFREDEHTDFKRELPGGDRGSAAIAVDLASFAISGGTIVVGIDEGPPATLSPIELRGQRERVAQIARSSVDPPLRVVAHEIVTAAEATRGYLVIEVPPSPDAPHAVGGVFRGRSGTTNATLTAAEVRRLHQQIADAVPPPILDDLRILVGLDPTQEEQRRQAHLFVLARPLRGPDEMLNDAVGDRWEAWTREHILNAPPLTRPFSPDFREAHRLFRRPNGWIATHYDAAHQPPEPLRENYGIEIEIGDDGSIRLFCSRASDNFKGTRVIFEILIGGLVRRVVDLAAVISRDAGFVGEWEIAVALTNLRGAVSHFRMDNWWVDADDCQPYPDFDYERIWRGSAEVLRTPEPIVTRLVGPLNRVLNDGACPMPGPA